MRTGVSGVQSGPICGVWVCGGVEGGEMPQVQDAHHGPFELDVLDWYMPSESSQK